MYPLIRRFMGWLFADTTPAPKGSEHLPVNGGFIIAANHINFYDGLFINAALVRLSKYFRLYFITKTTNWRWLPGTTLPLPQFSNHGVFSAAEQALQRGAVIVNFPEGHRNSGPQLLPGHNGTARMALQAGAPIVPCGLRGPIGRSPWHNFTLFFLRRTRIQVNFGPPIPVTQNQNPSPEHINRLTDLIMRAIALLADKQPPQVVR